MKYKNKRKIYFYSMLATFVMSIALSILIFLLDSINMDQKLIIFSIFMLIILAIILKLNKQYKIYDYLFKLNILLETANKPINSKTNTDDEGFIEKLSINGYKIHKSYPNFDTYFRFENLLQRSNKTKTAYIIVRIKTNLKFTSDEITKAINLFEDDYTKKEKFRNHFIMIFKTADEFDATNKTEVEDVLFINPVKNHNLVLINILFSRKEKKVYYINSKNHNPNQYYNYVVKEIEKLI